MAQLWEHMKTASHKAMVQGEILLLERDITTVKQALGLELYDIIHDDTSTADLSSTSGVASFVLEAAGGSQLQNTRLGQIYDACETDIGALRAEQTRLRQTQTSYKQNRKAAPGDASPTEKLANFGQWISSNTNEAKLEAQILLLDRKMRLRKETFGVQVFDDYIATGDSDEKKDSEVNVFELLTREMSKLSPREQQLRDALYRSKTAVEAMLRTKRAKEDEVERLSQH